VRETEQHRTTIAMGSLPAWSWSAATSVVNLGLGIATGVLVARILGPEVRGELAEAQFWAGAIAGLGICSLPSAASYFVARNERVHTMAASALALAVILALVSVAIGAVVVEEAADPAVRTWTLLYLAFFVPANFVGLTLMAIDHGNQNFTRYNIFRTLPQIIYLALMLLLWWQGEMNVPMLLAALWLGSFAVCAARFGSVGRAVLGLPHLDQMWLLFRTGISHHTTAFAGVLFQNADRLICLAYFTHADLGRYAVALTLSGAGLGIVSSATSIVIFPKLAAASGTAQRQLARNALSASFLLALASNAVLALLAPVTLPLLFGTAFADAVPVAMLLCLAQIPASFVQVSTIALRAMGDWRAGPYAQLLALAVFAPLAILLVPRLGLDSIAVSLIFSQTAAAALLLRRLQQSFDLSFAECLMPERTWMVARLSAWNTGASR
jgi:O-antigen/teichoic acid export membrane protein